MNSSPSSGNGTRLACKGRVQSNKKEIDVDKCQWMC